MTLPTKNGTASPAGFEPYRFLYFADLLDRPVYAGGKEHKLGKLGDLVFQLKEPYPELVGLFLEHGWGKPTEFIPWDRIVRIEERKAVYVKPPEQGETYPPFVDQPGWLLADAHFIGKTILDLDGRRTEVVNDIHCLESKGRLILVHVDTSFAGILRRWHLGRLHWVKDDLISWKHIQPLSIEDMSKTDQVSLSVTRAELKELPPEDLADALEELSGDEQEALFSALDSETAAEVLVEAEPRAQRQIVADLDADRAREVLGEMTVPEVVNLLSVLPHDDKTELVELLPPEVAEKVEDILSDPEVTAGHLALGDYLSATTEATVGQVLGSIRSSGREPRNVSYVYVVEPPDKLLRGVVDLRELVLASDDSKLGEIMTSPVVTAETDSQQKKLMELFAKYHFRLLPVVDAKDHILGVVRFADIMRNVEIRAKE
jgi:CBS domain-containing protein